MTRLLWISYCAPYAQVAHAGGKNHYYWLQKIREDESFEVKLLTFCKYDEYEKFQDMKYPFDCHCCVAAESTLGRVRQKLLSVAMTPYLILKFAGNIAGYKIVYIKKWVKTLKRQGYVPDTVLLHWTQIGLLYDWIHRIFPTAKLVVMEEDVTFLRTEREYQADQGLRRWGRYVIHRIMRRRELDMCRMADRVIVTNQKDKKLLAENGILLEKLEHIVSYYQDLGNVFSTGGRNILFYGAMNRQENIQAVRWFVEEVLPRLSNDYKLVILGGNPAQEVWNLASDRVVVTGFVEDIGPYFADALCMIAPLFSGAGIKIKVLEGMSAGLPVLTNEVGIEGIDAVDGRDYCFCADADAYIKWIEHLRNDSVLAASIGASGRKLAREQFDPVKSEVAFRKILS